MVNNLRRYKALTQWMRKQGVESFSLDGFTVRFAPKPAAALFGSGFTVPTDVSLTDEQRAEQERKADEDVLYHSAG